MDDQKAYIRRQIAQTRAAMTEKVSMIQAHVEETVAEAQSTVTDVIDRVLAQVKRVQDVIEHVTSTVDAAVDQVQDITHKPVARDQVGIELMVDLSLHPWVMMGTAVLAGYILGNPFQPSTRPPAGHILSSSSAHLADPACPR
jgi:NAD-specific glutamate dehydrogenase